MKTKLFASGPDSRLNAIIPNGKPTSNKWDPYAFGYKLAAEKLIAQVIEELDVRDAMVFPIIYLYRHYLELRLKEIIEHGNTLQDEPYKIPTHHDLMILWTQAKKVILMIWPDSTSKDFISIDKVMTDFVNIDKLSDAFRYPINTAGYPTLQGLSNINLASFRDEITPVSDLLEGITTAISVYEDYKEDMQRHYGDNY